MLFPAKLKMAVAGLTVAGGAAAAALLGPAGPAVGQSSQPVQVEIQVNSPATLVAKGAGAEVSVTASCSGQLVDSGFIGVSLNERAGSQIAEGFGSANINCTGVTQTVQVLVVAQAGKAFKRGTAIATGSIQACTTDFSFCADQTVEPTIAIQ